MIHRLTEVRKTGGSFAAYCLCGFSSVSYSKPFATANLYKHVIDATRKPCPTPAKTKYPNKIHADNVIVRWLRKPGAGARPQRSYECCCGNWHLTKQPSRERRVA